MKNLIARLAALLLATLMLGACASLSTSGPVERVGQSPASRQSGGGVDIEPQPPRAGASPEVILAGFLAAMAGGEPDSASARLYLTPNAQKVWNPGARVTIYESENNKPITTATSATLNVQVVGWLNERGQYTADHRKLVHDFGMTRVDGEWRINHPPTGRLIARYLFDSYYESVPLGFLDAAGKHVIPESIYLPRESVNPTTLVRALVQGPSAWLRPAVLTAIPGDTRMSVNAVTVADGVAEVSLTNQITGLAEDQRTKVAAQLVSTLAYFRHLRGVRILADGQPWPVPGASDGVVPMTAFSEWQLLDDLPEPQAYAIRKGRVGIIDSQAPGGLVFLGGRLGKGGWGAQPNLLAVHRSGDVIAVVNTQRDHLHVAQPGSDNVRLAHRGVKLLRPQVLADRSVVTIDHTGNGPMLVHLDASGALHRTLLPGLAGTEVINFRISPDRTRLTMVVRRSGQTVLGHMRIRGTDRLALDQWQPVPLTAASGALTNVADIAWAESEVMLVLASSDGEAGQWSVYRVRADGSRADNLGSGASSGGAVAVTAQPRRSGTSACFISEDRNVYQFQGSFRWDRLLEDATFVALPG